MKINYDPDDDILLIALKDEPLAYGEEITPQIIAHYSKDNELVEIEVLDANELFSKKEEINIPELSKQKVEDLKVFAIHAWENSKQSLGDAKALCEKGSYGHAIFFVELACEELAKALMYFFYPYLDKEEQEKIRKNVEKDHPQKMKELKDYVILPHLLIAYALTQFIKLVESFFVPGKISESIFEELKRKFEAEAEEIGKKLKKLLKLREEALYVDYSKKSKPADFSKNDCDEWINFGNKITEYVSFIFRLIKG